MIGTVPIENVSQFPSNLLVLRYTEKVIRNLLI